MDEDQILQSIIADPKLTDPSIDVGKLRQTTPTRAELLADVPEFSERGLGKTYGRLRRRDFNPYFPSQDIFREFEQISRRIGEPNPMKGALGIIRSMSRKLNRLRLDGEFNLNLDDYLPDEDLLGQAPLPETPSVNPALIQTNQQASVSQTGLTPTEQALLSPEEQAIRLRQRGMA